MAASSGRLSIGSQAGDYKILKKIGEGGMGEVFLVRHVQNEKNLFVLKSVLCFSQGDAKDALKVDQIVCSEQRLTTVCGQEAKVLKEIKHANVVEYLDVFPRDESNGVVSVCTVCSLLPPPSSLLSPSSTLSSSACTLRVPPHDRKTWWLTRKPR
eukprot:768207-Hanusia_phi.AAC.2